MNLVAVAVAVATTITDCSNWRDSLTESRH
jgi:hypothetical protein